MITHNEIRAPANQLTVAGSSSVPLDELNEETGCDGETADRGIGLIALLVGRPK